MILTQFFQNGLQTIDFFLLFHNQARKFNLPTFEHIFELVNIGHLYLLIVLLDYTFFFLFLFRSCCYLIHISLIELQGIKFDGTSRLRKLLFFRKTIPFFQYILQIDDFFFMIFQPTIKSSDFTF